MVAVVVNDGDVVDGAFDVEAAADSAEFGKAFADEFGGNVEIERDGCCRGSVADVVNAGRVREAEDAEVVAFVGQAEFAGEAVESDVADDEIGLTGGAVGEDGALDVGDDSLHVGFIEAEDGGAVKRNAIHELDEGVLNIFERGVLIEVLAVDGGDDGDDRSEK